MKSPTFSRLLVILAILPLWVACTPGIKETPQVTTENWKSQFNQLLPLLGHRNWILIVDKAFPLQTSPGLNIIDTGEKLVPALKYVLDQIDGSTHVQPVVYHDAEMNFLTPELVPGKEEFLADLNRVLGNVVPSPILHDSVFVKIDAASRLFRVVVLKTEETIPYSSVFIELGCKYWNTDQEKELRRLMLSQP